MEKQLKIVEELYQKENTNYSNLNFRNREIRSD